MAIVRLPGRQNVEIARAMIAVYRLDGKVDVKPGEIFWSLN